MNRNAGRLRDIPAVAIKDRGGIVEQLAHDGGTAGAPNGNVHLGGGCSQRVVDDLKFDWRDCPLNLHLDPPRDDVATLVAMATPAFEQEHCCVCLLDDR